MSDGREIKKIMSATLAEFHRSLAHFAPDLSLASDQSRFTVAEGEGQVTIIFKKLPSETFGGLLAMPRAQVTLLFSGLDDSEIDVFIERFDKVFQRGGG